MSKLDSIAEKNARVAARGEYMRWLAKRFGDIDLLLTMQGEDRVSLRKIYVPLRLDTEDRSDESMGGAADIAKEQLPGRDALDLIAEQPFVAISGRPGSGKTTLVQAIIGELAGDRPSEFRRRIAGERGIMPVPLILRDYQDQLTQVRSLDGLLGCWWRRAEREAGDKGFHLDLPRLRQSCSQEGDAIPILLLFDGIDEVGGIDVRKRLLRMAVDASAQGSRAVVLGRPTGLSDIPIGMFQPDLQSLPTSRSDAIGGSPDGNIGNKLDGISLELPQQQEAQEVITGRNDFADYLRILSANAESNPASRVAFRSRLSRLSAVWPNFASWMYPLCYVQPLAWPQIHTFIDRFFRLRQEWQVEREQLASEFDQALSDPQRAYLLNLARRPIFLTLMALVHASDRRMPHGRADLYRRIIDLYLVRQTQQRRLTQTTQGEPMPHWDEREVRRALGYLAWRSQHKGAEGPGAHKRDRRQVVWTRAELEQELANLLGGQGQGRFAGLKPDDAPRLLDYFLHPAGLLVEPAEGRYQFAHLSFQEYLCAEYIHGRAKAMGTRRFLEGIRALLYKHLGLPGWDEVGLLLLCIHAAEGAQAERTAHLELLAELDPADLPQARLLIAALTGRELDYEPDELLRWLPVAAAVALVQPQADLADRFRTLDGWVGPGLRLLRDLFRAVEPLALLADRISADPPGGRTPDEWRDRPLPDSLLNRWRVPRNDRGWEAHFGPEEARAQSLLALANGGGWVPADVTDPARRPICDPELEQTIADWLAAAQRQGSGVLYSRAEREDADSRVAKPTNAALELDLLVPDHGPLWLEFAARVPLDAWLLQGEIVRDDAYIDCSEPVVLLGYYPNRVLAPATRLAIGCQQILCLCHALNGPGASARFAEWQLGWRSRSLSTLRSWTRWFSGSSLTLRLRSRSRCLSSPRSESRSLWRFISLSLSRSSFMFPFRWVVLATDRTLSPRLQRALIRGGEGFEICSESRQDQLAQALVVFGYRFAALDWFAEQAEDADLMRRRGLRPGQPLPPELGLFDATGRIREQLQRESLVRLRAWLADDGAVLGWFFPEGLSAEDDKDLREQLHILHHYQRSDGGHGQPWSPIAALDAVLADWPEDLPTREVTLAAAERDLLAVLDALFPPDAEG